MKKVYAIILLMLFVITQAVAVYKITQYFLHPLKYEKEILYYSKEYKLSPVLVASVINVESSFKADAKSTAGAVGLMQMLPSTANYIAELNNLDFLGEDSLLEPEVNIKFGCLYLKYLIDKFNHIDTALASYNAGETKVRNWLKDPLYTLDQKTLSYIPYKETREYVEKVNENMKVYKHYNKLK